MKRKYTKYTDEQVREEANHFIHTMNTYSGTAKDLGMGQSTVWFHLQKRVKRFDLELFKEVQSVAQIPWRQRKGNK